MIVAGYRFTSRSLATVLFTYCRHTTSASEVRICDWCSVDCRESESAQGVVAYCGDLTVRRPDLAIRQRTIDVAGLSRMPAWRLEPIPPPGTTYQMMCIGASYSGRTAGSGHIERLRGRLELIAPDGHSRSSSPEGLASRRQLPPTPRAERRPRLLDDAPAPRALLVEVRAAVRAVDRIRLRPRPASRAALQPRAIRQHRRLDEILRRRAARRRRRAPASPRARARCTAS